MTELIINERKDYYQVEFINLISVNYLLIQFLRFTLRTVIQITKLISKIVIAISNIK